jgi:hypothetical protein
MRCALPPALIVMTIVLLDVSSLVSRPVVNVRGFAVLMTIWSMSATYE